MSQEKFYTKILSEFNDGCEFIGDEIQTALVCAFTSECRGGIKKQDFLEYEPIDDST